MTGASSLNPEFADVKAAGGVVWRPAAMGGAVLAIVHRPRYDDLSLPKGKLDPGETWEDAALREVREEIGARCELGRELTPVWYVDDKGRRKCVRYWVMRAVEVQFSPNDEVDELRWSSPSEAGHMLTYDHDRRIVAEAGL